MLPIITNNIFSPGKPFFSEFSVNWKPLPQLFKNYISKLVMVVNELFNCITGNSLKLTETKIGKIHRLNDTIYLIILYT